MCCRHSLAGSKQGKSRDCSRSGSKQQRRQERHFLVPTSHIFFSEAARLSTECPRHCGSHDSKMPATENGTCQLLVTGALWALQLTQLQ